MANEPVGQPYPLPQVEVITARDVGPHIPHQQAARAPRDAIPEAEWVEITDASKGRGIGSKVLGALIWTAREAVMPALYKLIPQGAQEIANGLFTGNPYWPGGATEIPVTEHAGPEIGPPAVEPVEHYPKVAAYEEFLSTYYAARGGNEQDRGMTR